MPAPIAKYEPLTPEQQALAVSCIKLAYLCVNQFQTWTSHRFRLDEVQSEAFFVLLRCAANFRPGTVGHGGKASKFSSYVANSIRMHLCKGFRFRRRRVVGRGRGGDGPTHLNSGDDLEDVRFVTNDERPIHTADAAADVERLLGQLEGAEVAVIVRRFGLRGFTAMTVAETAKALRLSARRVVDIELSAVARMREASLRDVYRDEEPPALPPVTEVKPTSRTLTRDLPPCRYCGQPAMQLKKCNSDRDMQCRACKKWDTVDRIRADRPAASPEQVAEVEGLLKSGELSAGEIGARVGVSVELVRRTKTRLTHPTMTPPASPQETLAHVTAALKQGGTINEIAARCGVGPWTVDRIKKKLAQNSNP